MRERTRRELSDDTDDLFDFRRGTGGIADIEFMFQYLVPSNARLKNGFQEFTAAVRLTSQR